MANDAGAIRAGRAYIELFTSDKALKAGLAGAQKSVMALGQTVKAVGAGLQELGTKMATIGLGAAAGIATASQSFGDYEQALASLRANTGLTTAEVAGLSTEILALSESMGQGPTEIARVMDELAKSGITVEKGLVATTAAVVKFSKVAGLGSEEAANAVTNAMNVFGIDAVEAMDRMSRAADASSISIQDVVMSFSQFAVVGHQAGLTIEDVAAAVALLGNSGVKASDAGTSLKSLMTFLGAPTETGAKVIEQYGLNFRDLNRNMLPLEGIVTELQRALGGLNAEARAAAMKDLFGTDAIRAGAILMDKGADGLKAFKQSMADSLSVSQKFTILMDTLLGSLETLRAGAERASIAIGDVFAGSFARLIEIVAGTLRGIADLVVANRDLVAGFARTIALVVAAGTTMAALGIAIGLVSSPIGLLAIGFGAAAVALEKFTDVTDDFATAWTAIGDLLAAGDLAGAARVGMQELQIVYQAGTLVLLKIWDDWGNAMVDVIMDMASTARRLMVELGHDLVEMATLIAAGMNTPVRVAWIGEIERQRQQLLQEIEAGREAEKTDRRGGTLKDLKDRQAALEAARVELTRLSEEAKLQRQELAKPIADAAALPKAAKAAEEVGRGLEAAKDKVDVKGTFSAIGAQRGLGIGDTVSGKLDEQIVIQEKELKELVKLNRKATPLIFST